MVASCLDFTPNKRTLIPSFLNVPMSYLKYKFNSLLSGKAIEEQSGACHLRNNMLSYHTYDYINIKFDSNSFNIFRGHVF